MRRLCLLLLAAATTTHAASDLDDFVTAGLVEFHQRRIERLQTLELETVLERKNPFLFRAKNPASARDFVAGLLDAHLSSQEEGLVGAFLEQTAIHVCEQRRGGRKSAVEGIDLEFEDAAKKTKYIVSIKSGPNWGNSSQIAKMRDHFRQARRILQTNATVGAKLVAVNGCCYGKTSAEDKGDYLKLCGQSFWELVSGDADFYLTLMDAVGRAADRQKTGFAAEYEKTLERFARQFGEGFCDENGTILWDKLLRYNSESHAR